METYAIAASYPAPGGHRILRPRDRSCWLMRHPDRRYTYQCWTRKDAVALAERLASRPPAPDARA